MDTVDFLAIEPGYGVGKAKNTANRMRFGWPEMARGPARYAEPLMVIDISRPVSRVL
jgi:hypothetical protein